MPFNRLFETHPDVQDVFLPFKGQSLDELKQSRQLKSHVLKVMGTVEKCLARIDEPDKMESLLHDLGAKHLLYNARVDYIDVSYLELSLPSLRKLCLPSLQCQG